MHFVHLFDDCWRICVSELLQRNDSLLGLECKIIVGDHLFGKSHTRQCLATFLQDAKVQPQSVIE